MNLVMLETTIRQDKEGRYCLNDLHKAAIASGLDVERKNPRDFFRTDMAKNFTASLQKVDETTHNPVVTKEGRNGGTYAVRLLAQRYCGWLSSDFEVAVYSLIDKHMHEEYQRKAIRENAREGYKDLSKALKEYKGEKIKWYHYANEADMINLIVLGCTAKDFRKTHNLKDNELLRDHLNKFQIETIEQLQRMDEQLINLDFNLKQRKEYLEKRFADLSKKLLKLLTA